MLFDNEINLTMKLIFSIHVTLTEQVIIECCFVFERSDQYNYIMWISLSYFWGDGASNLIEWNVICGYIFWLPIRRFTSIQSPEMAKIACLHDLNLKEDSGEMFVCFNDFVTYLQKNHKTTDDLKNIKPSNVHREFNRYNDAIKILDNTVCVRFHSVLRYMFNHSDNLDICRKISVQLTKYILAGKKYGQDKTILQIYESITASKCFQQTDEQMLGCLDNEAFSTPYIHNLYRSSLCLFKGMYGSIFISCDKINCRRKWPSLYTCSSIFYHCFSQWYTMYIFSDLSPNYITNIRDSPPGQVVKPIYYAIHMEKCNT